MHQSFHHLKMMTICKIKDDPNVLAKNRNKAASSKTETKTESKVDDKKAPPKSSDKSADETDLD